MLDPQTAQQQMLETALLRQYIAQKRAEAASRSVPTVMPGLEVMASLRPGDMAAHMEKDASIFSMVGGGIGKAVGYAKRFGGGIKNLFTRGPGFFESVRAGEAGVMAAPGIAAARATSRAAGAGAKQYLQLAEAAQARLTQGGAALGAAEAQALQQEVKHYTNLYQNAAQRAGAAGKQMVGLRRGANPASAPAAAAAPAGLPGSGGAYAPGSTYHSQGAYAYPPGRGGGAAPTPNAPAVAGSAPRPSGSRRVSGRANVGRRTAASTPQAGALMTGAYQNLRAGNFDPGELSAAFQAFGREHPLMAGIAATPFALGGIRAARWATGIGEEEPNYAPRQVNHY